MRSFLWCCIMMVVGIAALGNRVRADETAVPIDKLPKEVVKAVKDKYPTAELVEATQDEDDGEIKFEVTIKDGDQLYRPMPAAAPVAALTP